jgi:hypothetical protein
LAGVEKMIQEAGTQNGYFNRASMPPLDKLFSPR